MGLQIDQVNSYSKGGFITITFYKISTLLDFLGRSSNFFAPRLSCISETRKIEDSVFLFAVLQKIHFHVECRPGSVANMTLQSQKKVQESLNTFSSGMNANFHRCNLFNSLLYGRKMTILRCFHSKITL